MSDDLADLRAAWADVARDLGLAPSAGGIGDDLLRRWSEPHRGYHSVRHLAAVLRTLDELHAPHPPSAEARAAVWFHDAVYEGVAGEDEERSALLATEVLGRAGLDERRGERIADMVRATAGHLDPATAAGRVDDETAALLDADLAILAAPTEVYDAYVAGVRAEHPEVDDTGFARGRAAAVRHLLHRRPLFRTAVGQERFEALARQNLTRELQALEPDDGPAADG